jgi:CRISPR-associated exonuclease Cas4
VRVQSCPVRYYYERNEPIVESDRYAICKQISYHLGMSLELEIIWDEVLAVRPGIDPDMRPFLETCIIACDKNTWRSAVQNDVMVHSDKQGIVGMVDRLASDGNFSIIRAAGAMPFGTYSSDRLRIAGIGLCLEEMTGNEVHGGHVEYIPDGVSRFHTIQPRDRRQVIASLHRIHAIREGELPRHPLNAPCNRCRYREKCENSDGHRLSDLL